jgi:hypothetical protein
MYMRYHNVGTDDEGNMTYATRKGRVKMYGGYLVENIVQCLARVAVGEQMLRVQEQVDTFIVTCTHDEIVSISRDEIAEENQAKIIEIMSQPPRWARSLPLAAAGGVYQEYVKE